MLRLFRLTLVLGAVLLLSLTTALGLTHGNRGPVQSIVIEQRGTDPMAPARLALVVPDVDDPYVFTPDLDNVTYHGLTSDGTWMIYVGHREANGVDVPINSGLFRTRGLLPDSHLTAERVGDVHLMDTPTNGEWLVYESWNNLYLSRFDGAAQQDIRSLMPSGTWPDVHHGVAVSPEGDAVLFTGEGGGGSAGGGYGGRGHEHAMYRLRVSVGQVENVSDYLGGQVSPVAWLDEQNWVVISHNGGLYWKSSVGDELAPLFDKPANGLRYVEWFREAGVMMVAGQVLVDGLYVEEYYGFRPGEAMPIWSVSSVDSRFFDMTPDEQWLIFGRNDRRLERMHPDGSAREVLTALPDDLMFPTERGAVSPDGQWILGWKALPAGGSRVYRVHVADGTPEFLLDTPGAVGETDWSPDGAWALIADNASANLSNAPMWAVHIPTHEQIVISDGYGTTHFAGWGPMVGKTWSVGLLVLVVVGLSGAGLMRRPRRV